MMKRKRFKVFISYSNKDIDFVKRLERDLTKFGTKIWIDKEKIGAGDVIPDKIKEGIRKSDYLIVVLSPNSVKSTWVKWELDEAETFTKVPVIPILIKELKEDEIPTKLLPKKYVNFRDPDTYNDNLFELLKALKEEKAPSLRDRVSSPLSLIVVIITLITGLNVFIYNLRNIVEAKKIENYQETIQEIDNTINSKDGGIKKYDLKGSNEIIYKDIANNDIVCDQFDSNGTLKYRIFYNKNRVVAKDYFEKSEDGQWQKRRVHYDKGGEAFLQEYFTITGQMHIKEYDKNRDGIFVQRSAIFSSPFPPIFFYGLYR